MQLANPMRCGKKTRGGGTCGSWAMHGQLVCRMHGGSAPQARAAADERLRALVHPAISSLARQIEHDEFAAVRYVLEIAGYKPTVQIQAEAEVLVRVIHEDQPIVVLDQLHAAGRGTDR